MAQQEKVLACGPCFAALGLVLKFALGPVAMAIGSIAVGLRGDVLRVAIIQVGCLATSLCLDKFLPRLSPLWIIIEICVCSVCVREKFVFKFPTNSCGFTKQSKKWLLKFPTKITSGFCYTPYVLAATRCTVKSH